MSQQGPMSLIEQRKRDWLVFTPAFVLGFVTGNVLMDRLSGPLGWVLAGAGGVLVYLTVCKVLGKVVAHARGSRGIRQDDPARQAESHPRPLAVPDSGRAAYRADEKWTCPGGSMSS